MNLKRTAKLVVLNWLIAASLPAFGVASADDFSLISSGPAQMDALLLDLSRLPILAISSLTPKDPNIGNKQVRIRGQVLDARLGEYLVVHDETGTIVAETHQAVLPKVKAQVDVWGTLALDGVRVRLENAFFRSPGSNSVPAQDSAVKPDQLPTLTKAWQVRDLSAERAAWKYPVRLRAVVTVNTRTNEHLLFVQDDTSGIFVRRHKGQTEDPNPGDVVEIEGVSDPGGFAPVVLSSNLTVVSTGPLPEPRQVTLFQLATGQEGSQWIEVHGVVRAVAYTNGVARIKLSDPSGMLSVNIPTSVAPTNLLDSVVRIRGACSSESNKSRQLVGLQMWASSMNDLEVEEAGAVDPLASPAQPIVSLSQFRPRQTLQHRVTVAGIVTVCQAQHSFFLQDNSDGTQVLTTQKTDVKPGDRVLVAGYPSLEEYGSVLREAIVRVIKSGPIPAPEALTAEQALHPQFHDRRVQTSARLLNYARIGSREVLTLQLGDKLFDALCLQPAPRDPPVRGSLLQLTGVYRVLADEARVPLSFQIILPSRDDFKVLEAPMWWEFRHTVTVLGLMCLIVSLGILWVITLRRRVREQTAIMQQSELKFRSLVEQSLVGVYIIQNGRFAYANPRLAEIFGYQAEEMMRSCKLEDVVLPEDLASVQEQIRRRLAGEVESTHHHFRGRRKDGSIVHVEVLGSLTKFGNDPAVLGTALDITERKRAEEELRRSRQMLRTVLDNIPQRVFWKDENSVYVGCNKAFALDCGYSDPADMVGRTDFETSSTEIGEIIQADDKRVMTTGSARINSEEPQTKPDGSRGWIRTSKVPLFDSEGKSVGVLGTYEDVTDRKRAEAALAEASSLLETMLENSPDYIYFKDRESRFVRASKSLARVFHISHPDELKGKTDFDYFRVEHAQQAFDDEQQIIRSGVAMVGKPEKETHADGRTTWALSTKLPWRDKDGNIIGTFGISKDVTELKEAEMKADYERDLFRALAESLPDAIYFKDRESRFVRLSKSKLERSRQMVLKRYRSQNPGDDTDKLPSYLTDLDRFSDYLIGKTDFDVFSEERARVAFKDEQEIIRTGRPLLDSLEKTIMPDGSKSWCLTTKMPWRDKHGNVVGTFGVSRDVTALKEAESQLESAHQRLVETSRLAGMAEVATDVLHNVGNVLNSVNVSCSLSMDRIKSSKMSSLSRVAAMLADNRGRLAEFFTTDPRGQQIPDYMTALADHLSGDQAMLLKELEQLLRHIDHIKQIVAMQQSYAKVSGVRETISPVQLVEDALHINAAALTRHEVSVERDFEQTPFISTEKHKVLQILVNLIRNAKYAMDDAKRPDKLLKLKIAPDGDSMVRIQVQDNGIGIPPENLTRIFGHGFTTRRNGHGFGLHSSALAVRDLGGSLTVQSEGNGKGALFTLMLPCQSTNEGENKI
jgi:PAS domain S-box-containing protein